MRKFVGVTQGELASQIGVTPSIISAWENGKISVSPELLQQFSEDLGILPARLLNLAVVEVEMASHTALYAGRSVHRMVLSVDHPQGIGDRIKSTTP